MCRQYLAMVWELQSGQLQYASTYHGSFSFREIIAAHLGLLVKRDVRHLLAGVEQGVLGGLGEHVLRRTNQHGSHEGGQPDAGQRGRQRPAAQHQPEEGNTCI